MPPRLHLPVHSEGPAFVPFPAKVMQVPTHLSIAEFASQFEPMGS
jgi:hypothetical protein